MYAAQWMCHYYFSCYLLLLLPPPSTIALYCVSYIQCAKQTTSAENRSIGSTTGCTITEKAPLRRSPNFTSTYHGVNARLA